jgi:hypothetical protein
MPIKYLPDALAAWLTQVAFAAVVLCIGCASVYADGTPAGQALQKTSPLHIKLDVTNTTGKRFSLHVARDPFAASQTKPLKVRVIAEPSPDSVVVIDSFRSRRGGMSMCQAGIEKTLRVLVRIGNRVQERERVKIESCHENIELANGGIDWNAADSTLRIRWLQGPTNKGMAEQRDLKISSPLR